MGVVVLAVTVVLCLSQWADSLLSREALEQDATDRALLAARVVDSLWDGHDWPQLTAILRSLVGNHREIRDVDVVELEHEPVAAVATTRGGAPPPSAIDVAALRRTGVVDAVSASSDGERMRRLDVAIRRDGRVVGAVHTEVSLAAASALQRELRTIDLAMLAVSISALCATLTWFVGRRVERPIHELVAGMRAAEGGTLGVRIGGQLSEEFDYLARSFNRMLERIQELTTTLESRVRRATHDLAQRNLELRDANAHLRSVQLEAARSERFAALGQMAATLAHDLGTPLNSVLGYTQLLRRSELPPQHAAKLEVVESQVLRMIETMRNLLDRTRAATPRRTSVAVRALVADATEVVASRIESQAIELRCSVAPDVGTVPGDPVALRQMLVNLLVNAIDAVSSLGVIHLGASIIDGGQRKLLELTVADDGAGIAEEHLAHVFDPFFTTKGPEHGTGLGLAIVQRVAQAHGGSVAIESVLGGGTTMRVRLPLEVEA